MTPQLLKRTVKRAAGLASVALRKTAPSTSVERACILSYHRITSWDVFDPWLDDWNVTPASLERHVASLAGNAELVFVRDLPEQLSRPRIGAKPLVCLTFDDGYRNFHDEVLPILERYNAKATAFVVTGYVGSQISMPFDRWGTRHCAHTPASAWQPLGWRQIETCVKSGLVEIGGHSHWHVNTAFSSDAEIVEEAHQSRAVLRDRLGEQHAQSYAYPYGNSRLRQVTPAYMAAVRSSGYRVAVSTNFGLADPSTDPYLLPRVEVYRSDSPAVVRAKVAGSLLPYSLTDLFRSAHR